MVTSKYKWVEILDKTDQAEAEAVVEEEAAEEVAEEAVEEEDSAEEEVVEEAEEVVEDSAEEEEEEDLLLLLIPSNMLECISCKVKMMLFLLRVWLQEKVFMERKEFLSKRTWKKLNIECGILTDLKLVLLL